MLRGLWCAARACGVLGGVRPSGCAGQRAGTMGPMLIADWVRERVGPGLMGRRVCVTGGAGFIGGHIAEALVGLGAEVVVIDDLSASSPAVVMRLMVETAGVGVGDGRLRFVHGSVLETGALEEAVSGAEVVFHLAGICSVPRSMEEPVRTWQVNATGTVRVLEASRAAGVRRVVYSSSSSAYGEGEVLPKHEGLASRPVSPYAAAKLAGEQAVTAWGQSYAMDTVSLRYFNIFGPRQAMDTPYAGVVPAFAKRLLAGERPRVAGDGEQTRDLTFVQGPVEANLLAATVSGRLSGAVANVGTGGRMTINELARRMASIVGRPELGPEHGPARAGDVRHSQADVSRARELLGYRPPADVDAGLRMTIEWYRGEAARSAGLMSAGARAGGGS